MALAGLKNILYPTIREWKPYSCKPFELDTTNLVANGGDIYSTKRWDETKPEFLVTSDACAGRDIGLQCVSSTVNDFLITYRTSSGFGDTYNPIGAHWNGGGYFTTEDATGDWLPIAEGVYVKFSSFSGAADIDEGDRLVMHIPDINDNRWERVYFGGYTTYLDLPSEPVDSSVSNPIPYMPSLGQGWTIIFNVNGVNAWGSTLDEDVVHHTDVRLISAPKLDLDIVSDEFSWDDDIKGKWRPREATAKDLPMYTNEIAAIGVPLVQVIDKSFDATGLTPSDINRPDTGEVFTQDGYTGLPSERIWLHYYDDPSQANTADYAVNQFVAIMIIPM